MTRIIIGIIYVAIGAFYSWRVPRGSYVRGRWVAWHDIPVSVATIFGMLAVSALVVAALLFARKGRTIRLVGIFLGSALIISVLGYGLAALDSQHVSLDSIAESVEVGWLFPIPVQARKIITSWPLFPVDIVLRLVISALLLARDNIHRTLPVRVVDVVGGVIALVYASLHAYGAIYILHHPLGWKLLWPPEYAQYFWTSPKIIGMRALLALGVSILLFIKAFRVKGHAEATNQLRTTAL